MRLVELEHRHSGLGIASFSIFLAGVFIGTVMILVTAAIASSTGWRSFPGPAMDFVIGGLILGSCLNLVALGLGIAGLCQKGRKKRFAIVGTALSSLFALPALAFLIMVIQG